MVINTKEINEKLKNPSEFLTFSENRILNQIDECAAQILPLANTKPIILISGPSGSSKTTTAIKLAKALRKNGADVCYISMDKYFKNFTDEEKALKRQNKLDLESPERVDAKCLNKDIDVLLNGGEIYLPSYDFLTNTRTLSQTKLCRNGGFVIIEGIHALNPTLLGENDDVFSTKLYANNINLMSVDKIEEPIRARAKIRYSHEGADCTIRMADDGLLECVFDEKQRAVTPGQALVIYDGDYVLGGGTII